MTIHKRARSDSQKQIRRQVIIDEAWQRFQSIGYDSINMLDIAKQIGLAKGTLYLYFATKESLFLAVLEVQFSEWFDALDAGLQAIPSADSEAVSGLIVETLASRTSLVRLFAISHVILEHNVDYESVHRYKRLLLERVRQTGSHLERVLPFLHEGQGAELARRVYTLLLGVQQMVSTAPAVQEVIADDPELSIFSVDFSTELHALISAVIHTYARQQ